jgi:tape measure domain-containing protein
MSSSSAAFSIKFGADTKQLEKALKNTERQLGKTARSLDKIGGKLTRSLTLPLLGIGAAVVKAAVDMQSLEVSFVALTGGAEQAGKMVDRLNQFAASTPYQIEGIATAARQLIASGVGIDEVTNSLQFLGDIAATSGSSIEDIAAIFAKVKAKGKVELESLNQLAERGVPIFAALAKATGLPASKLGAGAVSVRQFETVLRDMAEAGGFADGAMLNLSQTAGGKFSTALDNLKIAGAKLGETLLPVIESLLDSVTELAQDFTALDTATQKSILKWGAYAAAIGPVLQGLGGMAIGIQNVTKAYRALKTSQTAASLLTKANPYVLAATAIAAIAIALYNSSDAFVSAKTSAEKYKATIASVQGSVREQSTEVRYLVEKYKDEAISLQQRERILNRLKAIDAAHFSNLTAENTTYADLVKNLDSYTNSLRKNYLEKILAEEGAGLMGELVKAEAQIQDKADALQKAKDEKKSDDIISAYTYYLEMAGVYQANVLKRLEAFEQRKLDLIKKYAALGVDVSGEDSGVDAGGGGVDAGGGGGGADLDNVVVLTDLEKLLERVAEQKARISAIQLYTPDELAKQEALAAALADAAVSAELLGESALAQQYDKEADAAERLANKIKLATDALELQAQIAQQYGEGIQGLIGYLESFATAPAPENKEVLATEAESVDQYGQQIVSTVTTIGNAITQVNDTLASQQDTLSELFANGEIDAEEYAKRMEMLRVQAVSQRRQEAMSTIANMLMQTLATAIYNAYQTASATGPAAAGLGPILAASGVAAVTSAFSAVKFAQGGMVTGETLALVGDNQSGKEAIIPFERMGEFLGQFNTSDSQHIVVSGRLSGSDILLSAERSKRGTQRVTGVSF